MGLQFGNPLKVAGDIRESLLIHNGCKCRVECAPHHLLAGICNRKVLLCIPDCAGRVCCGDLDIPALELFEEEFCVLSLVLRRILKIRSDLFLTFFTCDVY